MGFEGRVWESYGKVGGRVGEGWLEGKARRVCRAAWGLRPAWQEAVLRESSSGMCQAVPCTRPGGCAFPSPLPWWAACGFTAACGVRSPVHLVLLLLAELHLLVA